MMPMTMIGCIPLRMPQAKRGQRHQNQCSAAADQKILFHKSYTSKKLPRKKSMQFDKKTRDSGTHLKELVNSSYQYYTSNLLGKSRGTFFEYRGVPLGKWIIYLKEVDKN